MEMSWCQGEKKKKKKHTKEGLEQLSKCCLIEAGGAGGPHLLPGEYVLVEVELDLLVGDVDAQLLEGVLLEVLETEDVQDADVQALVVLSGRRRKENIRPLNSSFVPKSSQ